MQRHALARHDACRRGIATRLQIGAMRNGVFVAALVAVAWPRLATAEAAVFRCPGKPAIFTSDARLASSIGCESLDRRVRTATRSASADRPDADAAAARAPAARTAVVAMASTSNPHVVPRAVQQERDDDRKRILQTELGREQSKHQALADALSKLPSPEGNAEGERLLQALRRNEGDIEALRRELAQTGR